MEQEKEMTAEDFAAQMAAAEMRWREAAKAAADEAGKAAYAEGAASVRAEMQPQLDAALAEAEMLRRAAAERERELSCMRALRARNLDEALAPMLLSAAEDDVSLERGADALASAVETAARKLLCEHAAAFRPSAGKEGGITGRMLREMPVAKLAELMR